MSHATSHNAPGEGRVYDTQEYKRLLDEICFPGSLCWMDGLPIRFDVPPRHPLSRSLDHVVPLSRGGAPLARENLRAAHFGCNSGKRDRDPKPPTIVRSRVW